MCIRDSTCSNLGSYAVVLTVTDGSSNQGTCGATVTVADDTNPCTACSPPTAVCQDATVSLDANGSAVITVATIDNSSAATCGLSSISVDIDTVNCSNAGTPVTATLTVIDINNDTATCSASVTVADTTKPAITCPADFATCSPIFSIPVPLSLTDNCAGVSYTNSHQGAMFPPGMTTVTYTANDVTGNTSACSFTVNRTTLPVANAGADATVILGDTVTSVSYTHLTLPTNRCG